MNHKALGGYEIKRDENISKFQKLGRGTAGRRRGEVRDDQSPR